MVSKSSAVLYGVIWLAIDAFDTCFPTNPKGFYPPGPMLATLKRLHIKCDTEAAWKIYRTLEHLLYRGMIPSNRLFWELVLGHLGIAATQYRIDELSRAELRHYYFPGIALYDGVPEFLQWAREDAKLKTILWSNATWTGWETEVRLGLPELFSQRAVSCLDHHVKNRRVGEKSLLRWSVERFGIRTPKTQLAVVDDQLSHLSNAYSEFACRTVLVLNGKPAPKISEGDFQPTLIIDRLADLQLHIPAKASN